MLLFFFSVSMFAMAFTTWKSLFSAFFDTRKKSRHWKRLHGNGKRDNALMLSPLVSWLS